MARKQKILVSVNVNCHCGIVLEHSGDDIHREIEQLSIWLEDLEFKDVPGFGIWIWEGYAKYDVDSKSKQYDLEWIGKWRELTVIEWNKIMKKEKLWNYQSPKETQQNT